MKNLKNYWLLMGALFSLMIIITSCDDDDDDDDATPTEVQFDNISLSGAAVAPTPVTTDGSGTLNATYNRDTKIISYDITWTLGNEADETTAMHFHGPASTSESAGVVIGITLPNTNSSGTVSGETRALTEAEENDMLNGLWYLNIHSTTYPAGELRGQLGDGTNGTGSNGGNNNNGGTGY